MTMMINVKFRATVVVVAAGLLTAGAGALALQETGAGPMSTRTAEGKSQRGAGTVDPPRSEAESIAAAFLKAGSELFDSKDAAALAATYTMDGEVVLVGQKDGQTNSATHQGRAEIEEFYRKHFGGQEAIDSENTVDFARLITPELLVVHGRFRPNTGLPELPFVQMRVKRGDRWLVNKLWLFITPGA